MAALALFAVSASALAEDADSPPVCVGEDLSKTAGLAAAEAKRADDLVNSDGIFWRIAKPGLPTSYLFGTIHSTDDSAVALARRAAKTIGDVKVVATELGGPFDPMDQATLAASIFAKATVRDADTFEGALGSSDVKPVETFLATRGFPAELAHHLGLWFLAIVASLPPCEGARQARALPEVDQLLAQTAHDEGVKVIGLETAEEQIAIMAAMKPSLSALVLVATARNPKLNDDVFATMLELYRQSRPAEILAVVDAVAGMSEAERAAEREFTVALLVNRNEIMAERAAPLLKTGGAFIAVGALHLSGKHGLVARFRDMGYTVDKIW